MQMNKHSMLIMHLIAVTSIGNDTHLHCAKKHIRYLVSVQTLKILV